MKSAKFARRRGALTTASVAAMAIVLSACGGGDAAEGEPAADAPETTEGAGAEDDAGREDLGTVTVALSVPESVPFLPADLGPSQGAFEECGITVENITGESSTVGRSLAAGEADIALQFGTRAVGEIMQGIPAKVVAGQENPWSQVIVVSDELAEAGIESAEDIRNVGSDQQLSFGISSSGSAGHLSVLRLAEDLGWTEGEEFEIVPLGGVNEITAGLEAGAIDAFTWSREVAYTMESAGVGHVIEEIVAEAVGPTIFELFVASDTFIEERPDALKAYFECYFDYVNELKQDPERVRQLAIEEWDKDPQAIDQTLEQIMEDWSEDGAATDEQLQGLADGAVFQNDEVDEAPIDAWWTYWQDVS
jgi:NitT/TauT family transport system substrate-binding protein